MFLIQNPSDRGEAKFQYWSAAANMSVDAAGMIPNLQIRKGRYYAC